MQVLVFQKITHHCLENGGCDKYDYGMSKTYYSCVYSLKNHYPKLVVPIRTNKQKQANTLEWQRHQGNLNHMMIV